jgi:hypothetical protein
MRKGDEVFISYAVDGNFVSRRNMLSDKHIEDCRCSLCEEDLADGSQSLLSRAKLLERELEGISYESSLSAVEKAVAERKRFCAEIESTYRKGRQLRPELFSAYNRVAFAYGVLAVVSDDQGLYKKVLKCSLDALRCLGVGIREASKAKEKRNGSFMPITSAPRHHAQEATCTALQIAACQNSLGQISLVKCWVEVAMWIEGVTVGPGSAFFKRRYEEMLTALHLAEYVR